MADHIDEIAKMTPTPRGLQDCYFFYYSTCTKGERCDFRHEPAALGSEIICQPWQAGKCSNVHCPLRHMQLKKNRKSIPCYWESQPTGCRKPHCAFLHKVPRDSPVGINGGKPLPQAPPDGNAGHSHMPRQEPLIVNFQESMHLY